MADDIDIEEHSLGDNPDVSGIFPDFPDLDTVKTEVIDIEDGFEDHHANTSPIPSTSVIPDSTTDVDFNPPRTTDSPHIISSTSIPEDPEEITDKLNIVELVKTTETIVSNNISDESITISENNLAEELDLSIIVENDIVPFNASVNEKPITGDLDDVFVDVINDNEIDKDAGNGEAFFGNCIILGSKSKDVDREEFYEDDKCFNSFVALEDWGPYLSGSDCYCSECEILFATVNALDFHKMQAHSHLVAVFGGQEDNYASDDSPKDESVKIPCGLCSSVLASKQGLQKHMKLMHNPNSIPVRNNIILGTKKVNSESKTANKSLRTYAVKSSAAKKKPADEDSKKGSNVCFVCQFQCSSDDDLINHLYKLHTFRCEVCNTVFAKKDQYDVHMLCHNPQLSIKQQKVDTATVSQNKKIKLENTPKPAKHMVRRCNGCPAQFAKIENLRKHCLVYKLKFTRPLQPFQRFDPVCSICGAKFLTCKKYNNHIRIHNCHSPQENIRQSQSVKILVAQCKFCPAQFVRSKYLMYHCEAIHKITLPKKPPRNKSFNPRCPNCPKTFTNTKTFNSHFDANHSCKEINKELVTKTFPAPLKLPLQTSTKVSYKCLRCEILFPALPAAKAHADSSHSKLTGETVITKVTQQIALIQTNFLFRCDKCDVHFASPSQAYAHSNANCEEQNSSIPCKQCKLKINMNDVASHNKKHEINDELTVIDVSDSNLNDRILCKCPSCRLHFNEADYILHYGECSSYGRIPYWCVFCDLYIDIKAQPAHDRFHYELKLKKDALIILLFKEIVKSSVGDNIDGIDNVVDKTEQDNKAVTSGMDPQSEEYTNKMEAIKMKTQGIYKLIECTVCDTFRSFHIDSALDHIEGQCKTLLKRPCYFCGIRILNKSSKTHEIDHSCYPKLNIKDTIFFDENLNVTKPRVPKLVKCVQCSVSFESEYDLSRHSCGKTKAERCGHCNEDVVISYFNFHTQYHEYRLHSVSGLEYAAPRYEKNLARNEDLDYDEEASDSDDDSDNDTQDLNNDSQETSTKNQTSVFFNLYKPGDRLIVYRCKNCKLSSFGSAFRELHKECKITSFTCNICNLKFGNQYRTRHRKFHCQYPNFNINTFDIIEFAFGDNEASNETRSKKLSFNKPPVSKKLFVGNKTSINSKPHLSNTLAVTEPMSNPIKAKLARRGIAVFYQCRNCKLVSIGRNFLYNHLTCIDYENVYTCNICKYSCAPHYRLSHIYWHRTNPKIKKDHIIISPFNPGMVRTRRPRKMLLTSKPTTHITKIHRGPNPDNSLGDCMSKKQKIFECVKCGFASTSVSYPHTHKDCEALKRSFYCEICEIKFFYKFKRAHKEYHATTPNVDSDHFKIIRFDPNSVFRAISNPKQTEYLKSGKVVLFQCVQCKLVSSSRVIMQTHLRCDSPKQYHHCKICGYKVFMSDKRKHMFTHCNRPQLKRSEIIVSQFDPRIERQFNQVDDADEPPSANKKHIIFRCEICDICTEEGMDHECKEGIKKIVCGICSLTFEGAYYGKHAAKHSNPNFYNSIEIINIEGETPHHYRKRKLQSVSETPIKIPKISEVATTDNSFSASDSNTKGEDTLFKCPCDTHFLSRVSCANHIRVCKGGEPRQPINTCKYCHRNFAPFPPNRVLNEHISRHHVRKIKFKVINCALKQSSKSKCSNLKYANIYKCRNCCLFFPTFADCKSNRHLAICGISSGLPCSVCNLEIMECFIEEHAKIHSNGNYNSIDEFKVIVVSRDKVVKGSTSTENVLYKCTKCEVHFLTTDAIECHYPCKGSARRQIKCPECALKFYSANLFAHISSQHTLHNFDINDLIIKNVDPKEQSAEEANPIPEEVAFETDGEDSKPSETDPMANLRTKKRNTLYQCIKCKVNFVRNKYSLSHRNCSIDKPASNFTCDKCNMIVYLPDKDEHLLIHHSEDNNLTCEDDYTIHRQNSHYHRSSSTRVQYSKDKYPVFGCRAAKTVVKKPKKVVDEEEEPNVIYKCYECDICFIYKVSILKHSPKYALHDSAKSKMPCDECGLQFGPRILKEHKEKHHEELKLKLEDFKILTIDDARKDTDVSISESDVSMDSSTNFNDTSISKLKVYPPHKSTGNSEAAKTTKESAPGTSPKQDEKAKVKLYKCKDCNVNFLKQNLCYRHVIHHEPLSNYDFLECKICTLNFPIQYLQQHMAQHKTQEFGLKDILIEEYEPLEQDSPGTKRGTPKIDIYNAIDRDPRTTKDKETSSNSENEHITDNTDKENVNKDDSSKLDQTAKESVNAESENKELPNTTIEVETAIVKTEITSEDETANPEETLSGNILSKSTTASSSDSLNTDENKTVQHDCNNKILDITPKDDNSLQSMDIETYNNDVKILNGANADEKEEI